MPKKKYKSKVTYLRARRVKEYNKYKREYQKHAQRLQKKGLSPYGEKIFNFNEYFMFKEATIAKMGGKDKAQNVQRKIIQKQIYQFSHKQAILFKRNPEFEGLSLEQIRTGNGFTLEFLSGINEDLKNIHPNWTGKQRAAYIRREWFGYAS